MSHMKGRSSLLAVRCLGKHAVLLPCTHLHDVDTPCYLAAAGAILARTERCRKAACLQLDAASMDNIQRNAAVGGSGSAMLVTDLSATVASCGQRAGGAQLLQLGDKANAVCWNALSAANPSATSGPGLASVGQTIQPCQLDSGDLQGGCQPITSSTIVAAPGQAFNLSALVLDGFGQQLVGGISDANLVMGVQLPTPATASGRRLAQIPRTSDAGCSSAALLLGNTTTAVNGTAFFPAVTVFAETGGASCWRVPACLPACLPAQPAQGIGMHNTSQQANTGAVPWLAGTHLLRLWSPERPSLQHASILLQLRSCSAGEHNTSSGASASGKPSGCSPSSVATCQACSAPFYSFDPSLECQQCRPEEPAFCGGPAKVPNSGYWQSSPRSSQVGGRAWLQCQHRNSRVRALQLTVGCTGHGAAPFGPACVAGPGRPASGNVPTTPATPVSPPPPSRLPLSLQIHWCLSNQACKRSEQQRQAMVAWAEQNKDVPTQQLNDTGYMVGCHATASFSWLPFLGCWPTTPCLQRQAPNITLARSRPQAEMCSPGYTSVLCGSCLPGFGTRAFSCVQCMSVGANTALYVLMCVYLALLVAVGGWMVSPGPMPIAMRCRQAEMHVRRSAGMPRRGICIDGRRYQRLPAACCKQSRACVSRNSCFALSLPHSLPPAAHGPGAAQAGAGVHDGLLCQAAGKHHWQLHCCAAAARRPPQAACGEPAGP